MALNLRRLAGWSMIVGTIVASAGYLTANTLIPGGDGRFTQHGWQMVNGIALGGDLLVVLGLPAILTVQGRRAARLTLVGYVGLFMALVMLNIGEGVIEAFVKPYLATHGGIPTSAPTGYGVYETIALIGMLVGLICLGIAVIRARTVPIWVGILFIVAPLVSFLGLGGALAELSDYLCFIALFTMGVRAVRPAAAGASEPLPALA
ncbi:MAG: hypothetical protein ACXVW6_02180 [Nocardioidaceae bacterium]